eukprot:Hpha_TRINITY_DN25138_c0_g1::TRINITY_DN25138_c0_g1_i1::g.139319::m.139319
MSAEGLLKEEIKSGEEVVIDAPSPPARKSSAGRLVPPLPLGDRAGSSLSRPASSFAGGRSSSAVRPPSRSPPPPGLPLSARGTSPVDGGTYSCLVGVATARRPSRSSAEPSPRRDASQIKIKELPPELQQLAKKAGREESEE